MIETLPTVSPKTIGFKLSGKLHDEDYKSFMFTVESFLAAEGKHGLGVRHRCEQHSAKPSVVRPHVWGGRGQR